MAWEGWGFTRHVKEYLFGFFAEVDMFHSPRFGNRPSASSFSASLQGFFSRAGWGFTELRKPFWESLQGAWLSCIELGDGGFATEIRIMFGCFFAGGVALLLSFRAVFLHKGIWGAQKRGC